MSAYFRKNNMFALADFIVYLLKEIQLFDQNNENIRSANYPLTLIVGYEKLKFLTTRLATDA